jgi:hypothetical protein
MTTESHRRDYSCRLNDSCRIEWPRSTSSSSASRCPLLLCGLRRFEESMSLAVCKMMEEIDPGCETLSDG